MYDFFLIVISSLFGGIISNKLTKHHYEKTSKKKDLGIFISQYSDMFLGVDPEVKKDLKVTYKTRSIESIYRLHFIIANIGEVPIKEIIAPLTLCILNRAIILDATIPFKEPETSRVSLNVVTDGMNTNKVVFNIPLLNSGDYLIASILVDGKPENTTISSVNVDNQTTKISDLGQNTANTPIFVFEITADDLPATIKAQGIPNNYLTGENFKSNGIIWPMVLIYNVILFSTVIFIYWEEIITIHNLHDFYTWITIKQDTQTARITLFILILFFLILFALSTWFTIFRITKKPKFVIPKSISQQYVSY